MSSIEIIPAIMPHSFKELEELSALVAQFAQTAQLDVMDGVFVPSIGWPFEGGGVQILPESLTFGIHLMVQSPREIGLELVRAGAVRVQIHIDAITLGQEQEMYEAFKAAGAHEVGVSIKLETPLEALEPHIAHADSVQLLGIANIGYQGQGFSKETFARVREVHEKYPEMTIAVDGGVSKENIVQLRDAGATRFVVGSAILQAENPKNAYKELQGLLGSVV